MRLCLPLLLLAGCAFDRTGIGGDDTPIDARPPDPIDAGPAPDAQPGCLTWDAPNVDPCDDALPDPESLVLGAGEHVYDTDTGELQGGDGTTTPPSALLAQGGGGPELRVLNAGGLDVAAGATLTVVGSRPLVIVVHGSGSIDGTIDVAARGGNGHRPGAGGNDATACGNGTGVPGDPSTTLGSGGGGGGGGGFGEDGGDGGDGQGGGHGAKGGKGSKGGSANLTPLRGGCAGGAGGDDAEAVTDQAGAAGDGGGAIEITVRGTLSVAGTIVAGGSGGAGAQLAAAGAGGGGSGGAILLDADSAIVADTAVLCANGGGGGEGGQALVAADLGDDATCSELLRALGGDLSADGGNGGDGGFAGDLKGTAAANGSAGGGGGGGGGGVGRIRVRGRTSRDVPEAAVVTPAAGS